MRNICWIENCGKFAHAYGACSNHYQHPPRSVLPQPEKICLVQSCADRPWCKDLCMNHYNRVRRYGVTLEDLEIIVTSDLACLLCPNKATVVDHSHTDGHNRGFICQSCNILLGQLETGGLDKLRQALEYLEQDAKNPGVHWSRQFKGVEDG